MAQFDVYRLGDGDLVVDVQTPFLERFDTRVVVPLVAEIPESVALPRLHPVLSVHDEQLVLATHLVTAIPASVLRDRVATLARDRDRIVAALDVLMTGV